MTKLFEDYFSELQADMVSICLEYVNNEADNIYIYCFHEEGWYSFNVFYKIRGVVVRKHKLNEIPGVNFVYDTSGERQNAVLNVGIDNLKKIKKKCEEFGRDVPKEMKLHYDVRSNKLQAKYRYDLVVTHDEELLPDDLFDSWFEEVGKKDIGEIN
ncbi:DUF600 domain-containing protein [Mechercharimyces sp. CAU 1602]|uniref:DUF600 domain-containing protein n=1 Tax=Mechercharimyces sp. CAU 1602 TaxID=2973933 RepID=UPI002163379E|nr:DUF600 domain-containing protein [Mechercharimyces sp. CAU 1602]MCS1351664.1 DUF600 domain-containing protein [Mechercharimyces sp. CAU 1602]